MAALLAVIEIARVAVRSKETGYCTNLTVAASVLRVLSANCLVPVVHLEHNRAIRPSAVLALYITLGVIIDGTAARSYLLRGVQSLGGLAVASATLRFLLLGLQEVPRASLLIDPEVRKFSGRESTGGFWYRSCFGFMYPIFSRGYNKRLEIEDLANIGLEFSSAQLHSEFTQRWKRASQNKKHALILTCLNTWKVPILSCLLPRLFFSGFMFAQPFVIRRMVLSHKEDHSNQFKGGLVAATFLAYGGSALCNALSLHFQYRLLTRIRGGLVSETFAKSQRLKQSEAQKQAGITLVNTDVQGVVQGLPPCVEIPFSMFDTGLGLYFLTGFIKQASFIIILPLIFATFAGIVIGKFLGPATKSWNQATSTRVAKTSNIVSQLTAIRMLGLAQKAAEFLQHLRWLEIRASRPARKIQAARISMASGVDMLTPPIVIGGALFWNAFGERLKAEVVFPTLGIVALLQYPISTLLNSYGVGIAMLSCMERIQDYLNQEEYKDSRVILYDSSRGVAGDSTEQSEKASTPMSQDPSRVIHFDNASIAPAGVDMPILSNVNLSLAPGSVTALFGATGSGKTTIVNNILGEAEVLDGVVYVNDMPIALCGQQIWLPNSTVRECIVGMSEYNEAWFRAVVTACGLVQDIESFEGGEDYVVGSGGIKLSGGQRQRICMARGAYAKASTFLLDDAFSALDRPTARAVLSALLGKENGLLRQFSCTVLMTGYLPECMDVADDILFLDGEGKLLQTPADKIDDSMRTRITDILFEEHRISTDSAPVGEVRAKSNEDSSSDGGSRPETPKEKELITVKKTADSEEEEDTGLERRKGSLKLYWLWINEVGPLKLALWCIPAIIMSISEPFATLFVNFWVKMAPADRTYFAGYILVAATSPMLGGPLIWCLALYLTPKAGLGLHAKLTASVMQSTLGFLGTVDSGSIINRYSVDMELVLRDMPAGLYNFIYMSMGTTVHLGIALSGASYMGVLLPILLVILWFVQRHYLFTSRQLRHLDIESQAPLVTSFRDAADGMLYIRGLRWQDRALQNTLHLLDNSQKPFYTLFCGQKTLTFVLDAMTAAIATILAIMTVYIKGSASETSSGLSFTSLIMLGAGLNYAIKAWTTLETSIGSLARLSDFLKNTPTESDEGTTQPSKDWPSRGEVQIKNVSARYQCSKDKQEPDVIQDISLTVEPGQKLGIVGRTGSGKSSLLLTLLGFLEYGGEGSIVIDGVDIRTIPRNDLRRQIVTISQSQVELDGTIRDNLLPFDKDWVTDTTVAASTAEKDAKSAADRDAIVRETLEKLGIWTGLEAKKGLDTLMTEAGLSHGEKQLLCIARGVIRRRVHGGNLVLMDEATGGVDRWRDQAVREIMDEHFQGCTFVIVAHRPDSIADCEVVVRMARGKIVEVVKKREEA